jgi:hypothetical protein
MTNQEALDLFEEQLKRLKAMYDLFFNGARKLPPMEDRRRLEALIHELAKVHIRDNAHRFRYNTLLGRYNQYRELWGRMMREREEGPIDFRRRNAAMKAVPEAPPPPAAPPRVTSGDSESYVRVGSNGDHEAMLDLYTKINEANKRLGKAASISLQQVTEMVGKQADALRERYQVKTIAFRVETAEGKIKLKAKPVQE